MHRFFWLGYFIASSENNKKTVRTQHIISHKRYVMAISFRLPKQALNGAYSDRDRTETNTEPFLSEEFKAQTLFYECSWLAEEFFISKQPIQILVAFFLERTERLHILLRCRSQSPSVLNRFTILYNYEIHFLLF